MSKSDFPLYLLLGVASCVCIGAGAVALVSYTAISNEPTGVTPTTSTSTAKKEESTVPVGDDIVIEEPIVENIEDTVTDEPILDNDEKEIATGYPTVDALANQGVTSVPMMSGIGDNVLGSIAIINATKPQFESMTSDEYLTFIEVVIAPLSEDGFKFAYVSFPDGTAIVFHSFSAYSPASYGSMSDNHSISTTGSIMFDGEFFSLEDF